MSRLYGFLWIGWIAYFAIVEGSAFILRRTNLTLSDFTWRFEGTGWTAARYLVCVVMIWATAHLVWGLFR
jgi:hypothetical protein